MKKWKAFCLIFVMTFSLVFMTQQVEATSQSQQLSQSSRLFQSAKKVGRTIAANKFKYGKSKYTTLENSKKKKRSFCADYVTWALQENGDLPYNVRIYGTRGGKLAGSGKEAVKKNYRMIRINKRTSRVKFQPGDVVCVNKISGKYGWHMMIFARFNKNGKPLWYSGGRDATKGNGCYSKYKMTTPRRLSYYEKSNTAFILRRK